MRETDQSKRLTAVTLTDRWNMGKNCGSIIITYTHKDASLDFILNPGIIAAVSFSVKSHIVLLSTHLQF